MVLACVLSLVLAWNICFGLFGTVFGTVPQSNRFVFMGISQLVMPMHKPGFFFKTGAGLTQLLEILIKYDWNIIEILLKY